LNPLIEASAEKSKKTATSSTSTVKLPVNTTLSGCARPFVPCSSSDGACIPRWWLCDGREDCLNGEDEANCGTSILSASACGQNFACSQAEGDCLWMGFVCDGKKDCKNGSDETVSLCKPESIAYLARMNSSSCSVGEYSCGSSGPCIHSGFVCDGVRDCPDASDEGQACKYIQHG